MKNRYSGMGRQMTSLAQGAILAALALLTAQMAYAQSLRLVPGVTRYAGSPQGGVPSDSGGASTIPLNAPTYIAVDAAGNRYISDAGNNCVRRVDPTGNMITLVGLKQGGGGDTCNVSLNPNPSAAQGLLKPAGLAVDNLGNLFIADSGHNCIRELPAGGQGTAALLPVIDSCTNLSPASTSAVPSPAGLAFDIRNNLYISVNDAADGIFQVLAARAGSYGSPCLVDGSPSAKVSALCPTVQSPVSLNGPQGLAVDLLGALYIADSGNHCIRKVVSGAQSTAAGTCANDGSGNGAATLNTPSGIATDQAGYVYISDTATSNVFQLTPGGGVLLIAGLPTGMSGPYTQTQEGRAAVAVPLNAPTGLSADSYGDVYVADTVNNIVRRLSNGLRFPTTPVGGQSLPQTLQFVITAPVNLKAPVVGADFLILSNLCVGSITPQGGTLKTCQVNMKFVPTLPGFRSASLTLTDASTTPATQYQFGINGIGQSALALFTPGIINTLAPNLASPTAVVFSTAGDIYYAEAGSGSGSGDVAVLRKGSTTPTILIAPGGGIPSPTALALDDAGKPLHRG